MSILSVNEIYKKFNKTEVLKGVSFDEFINDKINAFETLASDFMLENGYIDTEKMLSEISEIMPDDVYRTATGRIIMANMDKSDIKEVFEKNCVFLRESEGVFVKFFQDGAFEGRASGLDFATQNLGRILHSVCAQSYRV
mgnify:CR=1 FL=1